MRNRREVSDVIPLAPYTAQKTSAHLVWRCAAAILQDFQFLTGVARDTGRRVRLRRFLAAFALALVFGPGF